MCFIMFDLEGHVLPLVLLLSYLIKSFPELRVRLLNHFNKLPKVPLLLTLYGDLAAPLPELILLVAPQHVPLPSGVKL